MHMAKTSNTTGSAELNRLELSQTDLVNLATMVNDAVQRPHSHQLSGTRFVTVSESRDGLRKELHLQVPEKLVELSDNDPRMVSWVMSEILASQYRPRAYRAMTTDVSLINDKKLGFFFKSHFHKNP
jgi:hypothetical protein